MAEPFIFINTYAIKPGKADLYKQACQEVAEVVEAKEPKMLYLAFHTSEDSTETTTVQVHADADNMAFHMELVGDHIQRAMEYLDASTMRIQIYGSPPDALLEQLRQVAGTGVPVSVCTPTTGFNRFPEI